MTWARLLYLPLVLFARSSPTFSSVAVPSPTVHLVSGSRRDRLIMYMSRQLMIVANEVGQYDTLLYTTAAL